MGCGDRPQPLPHARPRKRASTSVLGPRRSRWEGQLSFFSMGSFIKVKQHLSLLYFYLHNLVSHVSNYKWVFFFISQTVFTRLGPPHGRCQPDPSNTLQYSTMMCKQLCLEREYRRRCRCYALFAQEQNDTKNDLEEVDIRCSLFNTTQKVCMKKIAAGVSMAS
ncbi:uncharacterized protein LOC119577524 [Penaeus monodon]|uniref:uncharacterized protein LOC119577524 n=1 Tax=Penaeus monodon TaxID=6687 RepID=UPI0018A70D91|nr:uncharacterized protein LOC119577524 [Penaeus monodon]